VSAESSDSFASSVVSAVFYFFFQQMSMSMSMFGGFRSSAEGCQSQVQQRDVNVKSLGNGF